MRKNLFKRKNPLALAMLALAVLTINFVGCKKDKQLEESTAIQNYKIPKTSIIGGNPKAIQDAPYQAAILYNGGFNAGGVILNENWILTAAHVVTYPGTNTQIENNKISVRVGSVYVNMSGTLRNADMIIRHPNYTGQNDNDIALIHLSSPLVFDTDGFDVRTAPIVYATPAEDPLIAVDMPALVSGWGAISYNSSTDARTFTDYLFAADVKISSITSSYIYTSSTGSSQQAPCFGDSGGPLVVELADFGKVLVGVVNGWGDCNIGAKGYARVSSYASWITQQTGISRMFYNKRKTVGFQKSDCSSFINDPLLIFYAVPANKYSSTISQADADAKAMLEITQNGQQNANMNSLCYTTMVTPREDSQLPRGNDGHRYLENIYWNASLSPADNQVKIELLRQSSFKDAQGRYLGGYEYVVQELISTNAPNTGQLLNGLDTNLWNMALLPMSGVYRVKITAVNSGVYYLSDSFDLEKDED